MLKIKLSNLSFMNVVMRYYLMMALAFILGFAGQWILMSFVSVVLAASTIMGMSFEIVTPQTEKTTTGKIIQMDWGTGMKKAS